MGELNAVFREETFSHAGVTYKVCRPTFEAELQFETYLEQRALLKILARRANMGEANFRIALSVWERDCAAGEYAYLSECGQKALGNPDGERVWLWMVLVHSNPDMIPKPTEKFVKEILDAQRSALATRLQATVDAGETPDFNEAPELIAAYQRVTSPTPTMPPPAAAGEKS